MKNFKQQAKLDEGKSGLQTLGVITPAEFADIKDNYFSIADGLFGLKQALGNVKDQYDEYGPLLKEISAFHKKFDKISDKYQLGQKL